VPYLLEKRDERLTHDLRLEPRDRVTATAGGGTRSAYRVPLPLPDIWRSELVLTTRARVFRRTVRIGVLPPADRQGRVRFQPTDTRSWNQSDENTAARPLTLPVPPGSRGEVVLEIDEGDNQPLPIERATLLVPSYAVRFFRSGPSPLRLAYGRPDLASPQYDLSLLASEVMGQRAVQVEAGPERRPDGSDPAAARGSTAPLSAAAFWGVLGLAVIVLLGVVVRLVRRET
jgi:hypothetical protein